MIFSYGLTYGIALCAGWGVSYGFLLLLALIHTGILYGRKLVKKKKIPVDQVFLLLLFICGILSLFRLPWFGYFWNMGEYIVHWQGRGTFDLKYGWLLLYVMLAAGELLYRRIAKYIQTKLLLATIILGALIWQAVLRVSWDMLPVAALLYVALCGYTEGYQRLIQKRDKIFAKDMLPFLAGVILLVCIFPNSSKPISWDPVLQFWNQLKTGANEVVSNLVYWGDGDDFGVGSAGFSDDNDSFWGKLTDGFSREMMELSVNTRFGTEERYFTGKIKETYEANNWLPADESGRWELTQEDIVEGRSGKYRYGVDGIGTEDLSEYQWELEERLYYLYRSGISSSEDEVFCRSNTYFLKYGSLRTNTLFYPSNCYRIRVVNDEDSIYGEGRNLYFAKKQKRGSSYQVFGMQMNLENDALLQYLRTGTADNTGPDKADRSTLFAECIEALALNADEISEITDADWEKKLADREKQIRKTDLQLPKDLPGRVAGLAEELTADADNDYDKVQAIVNYLKKTGGYTYTTSPDALEEDRDVVDGFLFESKRGYCNYFASAAAILCRCAGVPSRYVEGVVVEYQNSEDGWYPILGKSAHSWTQVYIHGFGWIDVDATPGYETGNENWENTKTDVKELNQGGRTGADVPQASAGKEENTEQKTQFASVKAYVPYLSIGAGIVIFCFLFVFALSRILVYYAYQKASSRKRTEICMGRLLDCLRKRGLGLNTGETLREYGKRLARQKEEDPEYLEVLQWYEAIRYGKQEVDCKEVIWLEQVCRKEKMRNHKARREYRRRIRVHRFSVRKRSKK